MNLKCKDKCHFTNWEVARQVMVVTINAEKVVQIVLIVKHMASQLIKGDNK